MIVAGLLAAGKLVHTALEDHKFVFLGAGEAGTGIADLIALAIHDSCGKSVEEARKQIWLVDSKGLVVHERRESLQHHKLLYAHEGPVTSTCTSFTRVQSDSTALMDAINFIRPSVLIGVCTIPKSFTRVNSQYMNRCYEFSKLKCCIGGLWSLVLKIALKNSFRA